MRYELGAELYDAVGQVTGRDAAREAARVRAAWQQTIHIKRPRLLDVACGTGQHLLHLREHAEVEGADHSGAMLNVAARRLPGVPLHLQSMERLDLPGDYDVITCLLSGIAYPLGDTRLHMALRRMKWHLRPHGVLVVEPGPSPESVERLHATPLLFEAEGMLVERRTRWQQVRDELVLYHEFRVSTGGRRIALHELHEITLRDLHAHRQAMERAGFETTLLRGEDGESPLLIGRPRSEPDAAQPMPRIEED